MKKVLAVFKNCAVLHTVTFSRQTVRCTAFGQFLCSDTEVGLRDVALFNVFETNIWNRSGTQEREDGGAGGIFRNSRRVELQYRCRGIRHIVACWCYVLPSDSDCMKESSE